MADFNIVDFAVLSELQREQAAVVLHLALSRASAAYSDMSVARDEVKSIAEDADRVAFAAVKSGAVIGWIGAIKSYDGHAWEVHPLVVDPASQREGVGSALVSTLEKRAAQETATTLFLGTDDEFGGTNLFGVDLYPEPLDRLKDLKATSGHPFTFYLRMGFVVTGVIPDANGPGRHDIIMAKRIGDGRAVIAS